MAALQIIITYVPGLNDVVFCMAPPTDGFQWMIVAIFVGVVFFVMELERTIHQYLSSLGEDTNDKEFNPRFNAQQ